MADETRAGTVTLPIRWNTDAGTPTYYSTNMVVQSTDHEVVIMFFLAFPPLLIGSPEDIQEQIAEVSGIDAECQARIIIAKDRLYATLRDRNKTIPEQGSIHQQNRLNGADRRQVFRYSPAPPPNPPHLIT